jgi:hypothetical protein
MRHGISMAAIDTIFFPGEGEKPNTPNTPQSKSKKLLILKRIICVGSVLGWSFSVSGRFFRGKGND